MPQNDKTQQQQDRPQSSAEHRKTMLVVWTAMAHAFGSSWVSQYGTSEGNAFRSWTKALEGYSPDKIRRGVKNAADPALWKKKGFPPNLNEFARLCLTQSSPPPYQRETDEQLLRLEKMEARRSTPERVRKEFSKLREKFPGLFKETA